MKYTIPERVKNALTTCKKSKDFPGDAALLEKIVVEYEDLYGKGRTLVPSALTHTVFE